MFQPKIALGMGSPNLQLRSRMMAKSNGGGFLETTFEARFGFRDF